MKRRSALLLSCLLGLAPSARGEAEWPQFRGPMGQGISESNSVPIEWSATRNIAWKTPIPGRGWSSPALSDGKLYLTTADESGGAATLRAICVDAATGKMVWNEEVFRPDPAAVKAMHQKNSPASSSPIVADGRLYVHFGHLGTAALDLNGKVLWRQTSLRYSPVHGNGGSPALVESAAVKSLVFSCDGASDPFVVALNADTGAVRWKTPRNTPAQRTFSFSTPLVVEVDGVKQIILPGSGLVGSYHPDDGRELWRVRYGEGYSVVPRPIFTHGLLIVSSSFDSPILYAVRPQGAKGDATATHIAWQIRKGAPCTPSALAVGDEVYFVSDAGIATCVDAKSGKVHWTHRLGGNFSASPTAAGGNIYFQNEEGVGFVVKPGPRFQQLAENDLGERSLASYAVGDQSLYIRTDKHLWKIAGADAVR